MELLRNKVAIVTGGATGIGEAISKRFACDGAAVVVSGLSTDPVDSVVDEIERDGGRAVAFGEDISEPDAAKACIERAVLRSSRPPSQ